MDNIEECQLCSRVVDSATITTLKPISSLWSYMYHKNVRETLIASESDTSAEKNRVPKLTFTFSLGGNLSNSNTDYDNKNDQVVACEMCQKEVNQLETLHRQLESCKKSIAAQIERIENKISTTVGKDGPGRRGNKKWESLWKKGSSEDGLDVAVAGTSVGSDNISQVLRCLGFLCDGISNCTGNPLTSLTTTPATSRGETNMKMEQHAIHGDDVYRIGVNEPVNTEDAAPSFAQYIAEATVEGELNDERLDNDDTMNPNPLIAAKVELESTVNVTLNSCSPFDIETDSHDQIDSNRGFSQNGMEDPVDNDSNPLYSSVEVDPLAEIEQKHPTASTSPALTAYSTRSATTSFSGGLRTRQPAQTGSLKGARTSKSLRAIKMPCHICGKFLKSNSFIDHMKVHAGETPFSCEFCGKVFVRERYLNEHRRVHTKEKPFKCKICDRKFTLASTLKSHIKNVHKHIEELL